MHPWLTFRQLSNFLIGQQGQIEKFKTSFDVNSVKDTMLWWPQPSVHFPAKIRLMERAAFLLSLITINPYLSITCPENVHS